MTTPEQDLNRGLADLKAFDEQCPEIKETLAVIMGRLGPDGLGLLNTYCAIQYRIQLARERIENRPPPEAA